MTATTTDRGATLRNGTEELLNEARDQAARGTAFAQGELQAFLADVEDLVKKVAHVTDADVTRLRAKVEGALHEARQAVDKGARTVRERTSAAASATDGYVREKPWTAVGVAVAIGALLGFVARRR